MPPSRRPKRSSSVRGAVACKGTGLPSSRSPVYEQIVQDFLERAAEDASIPDTLVQRLKSLFGQGAPKKEAFIAAFKADEDVE